MRGLIAAAALLVGAQAAIDPIVIKVCRGPAVGSRGHSLNSGPKVLLQDQWHPVVR